MKKNITAILYTHKILLASISVLLLLSVLFGILNHRMDGTQAQSALIAGSAVSTEPEITETVPRLTDWQEYRAIGHALGMTEAGDTATNSLEAFEYSYGRGIRVFEGDIQITSDGVYVLRHDWILDLGQGEAFGWTDTEKRIPTSEEFLNTPIFGQYTPLTLASWFELMKEYPDIWFITDSKFSATVTDDFTLFVKTARECGCEEVLNRIIVQLYYPDMYEEVNSVYPFDSYILTLYYIGFPADPSSLYEFLSKENVKGLTMPEEYSEREYPEVYNSPNFKLYVHTINDYETASSVMRYAYGLYTDTLTEADLDEIAEELN